MVSRAEQAQAERFLIIQAVLTCLDTGLFISLSEVQQAVQATSIQQSRQSIRQVCSAAGLTALDVFHHPDQHQQVLDDVQQIVRADLKQAVLK